MPPEIERQVLLDLVNHYKTKANELEEKLIIAQSEGRIYYSQLQTLLNERKTENHE